MKERKMKRLKSLPTFYQMHYKSIGVKDIIFLQFLVTIFFVQTILLSLYTLVNYVKK